MKKDWKETLDCLKGTEFDRLNNDITAQRKEWPAKRINVAERFPQC